MQAKLGTRIAFLTLCLTLLAACQGANPAAKKQTASAQDMATGTATPFLVIESARVGDVDGQLCRAPAFALDEMALHELVAKADGTLPRLKITCEGKEFATLVALPKGGLLSLRSDGAYLLERGERVTYRAPSERVSMSGDGQVAVSVEVPASAPESGKEQKKQAAAAPVELMPSLPAPMAEGPEGAPALQSMTSLAASETKKTKVKVEGNVPKLGTAVHLASYKGLKAAKRGWKILLGDNDELDPLSPLYVPVEITGKGKMIRLYAAGADPKELSRVCKALVVKGVYCALNP